VKTISILFLLGGLGHCRRCCDKMARVGSLVKGPDVSHCVARYRDTQQRRDQKSRNRPAASPHPRNHAVVGNWERREDLEHPLRGTVTLLAMLQGCRMDDSFIFFSRVL